LSSFACDIQTVLARFPRTRMIICPELHLFGVGSEAELRDVAEPLTGSRVTALAELAGDLGVWLLPGTVCEIDPGLPGGSVFNTAVAFSPQGRLAAWYRKIFPWHPYEIFTPVRSSSCLTCRKWAASASASATTRGSPRLHGTWPGWAQR